MFYYAAQRGSLYEQIFQKQIPKRYICVVTEKSCPLLRTAEKFLEISDIFRKLTEQEEEL